MPFPHSWNITSPNPNVDRVSQFPSMTFYHGDKQTLANVIPLTDKGTGATLGWRTQQFGNVVWITYNAGSTDGTTWNRDDTGQPARAIRFNSDGSLEYLYAAAGANPITWTSHYKVDTAGTIVPSSDNARDIGASTARWHTGYFGTSLVSPTIGPSTTQQHTLPAVASDTVALVNASQTLSNKTLSSPTLSGTANATDTLVVPRKADPASPTAGEIWVNGEAIKYRDNAASPATRELVDLSRSQTLSNKTFASHFLPSADNTYDLGSSTARWRTGYFGTSLVVAGNTVWHAGNDGAGSGLDADLLDGMQPDSAATANTIIRRDAAGRAQVADPVAASDIATKAYVDANAGGIPDIRFLVQGNAMVANRVAQVLIGKGGTFTTLRAYADVAPAGADLIVRINKNGTQAATLSIAAGTNSASAAVSIPVAAGDRISLDITQVGTTTPGGNDLMVTLHT